MKNTKKIFGLIAIILITASYLFAGCDAGGGSSYGISINPPSLVRPSDNDSMVSLTPTFAWQEKSGTVQLQISKNSGFSPLVFSVNTVDTSYTVPAGTLEANTTYFWRAGQTTIGNTIYWSSYWYSFKIGSN